MKNLPLGIQTFSEMIEKNYLYVDKTKDIYNLFASGGKYYFLSRPRRFGKSILVSTLKELFSGNKELFKRLWIYEKIDWQTYPVIYIDFTDIDYETDVLLKKSLEETLEKVAKDYGVQLTTVSYKTRFSELIEKISVNVRSKVVILIDEYDKPIIDYVDKPEFALKNRDVLRNFYSIIKSSDEYLRFAFITGVSKFSQVSVFSGLNNLRDITLSDEFATMLGYTEDELLHYFKNRLEEMEGGRSKVLKQIREWYNGYSWDGKNFLYNPFSILNFFQEKRFDNYWFSSATPTFLVKLMKEREKDVRNYENLTVGNYLFESFDIDSITVASLLFQTGYLTVRNRFTDNFGAPQYHLAYPNREVRVSFFRHLFNEYAEKDFIETVQVLNDLAEAITQNDLEEFILNLKSLFAGIPSHIFINKREAYYHSIIYLILKLLGISIDAEVHTHKGRIDAIIRTDTHIYVMEFKMGTAEEALKQIKEKNYYQPYLSQKKIITLMGIGFDAGEKNISTYKSEVIKK